jgi:diguanylate cyclase (GGDEF)-like protein
MRAADLVAAVRAAFSAGRTGEALDLLERHGAAFDGDDEDRWRVARIRAVVLSRAGRHRDGIEVLDGVADGWLARGELRAAADIESLSAYLHHMARELGPALTHAANALVLLDESGDHPGFSAVAVHNSLGLLFADLEATDVAIQRFRRAIELWDGGDEVMLDLVKANLASAHLRHAISSQRDGGPSPEHLALAERQARDLLERSTLPRRRMEAATILASALLHADRAGEAIEVIDGMLHVSGPIDVRAVVDDPRALTDWELLLSWSSRERGDPQRAIGHANAAVAQAIAAADPIALSLAMRERSKAREALGDVSGALADLRSADDGARDLRAHRIEVLVEQLTRRAQLEAQRRRLEDETHRLHRERDRLELAVVTDTLTGVGNRRRFDQLLAELRMLPDLRVAVLMLDIDAFKEVNDALGHQTGDDVLVAVADVLVDLARDDDLICRLGGDEFAVVLRRASLADGVVVGERIRSALRAVRPGSDLDRPITVSVGVASGSGSDVAELVVDADDALMQAKRAGRDRVVPVSSR